MKIFSLKKTIERRFFLLSALKGISFGVLSWRLFDLQVIENKNHSPYFFAIFLLKFKFIVKNFNNKKNKE